MHVLPGIVQTPANEHVCGALQPCGPDVKQILFGASPLVSAAPATHLDASLQPLPHDEIGPLATESVAHQL